MDEIKQKCNHICDCPCHTTKSMKHFMACCRTCKDCNKNIEFHLWNVHTTKCHSDHNLIDGQ